MTLAKSKIPELMKAERAELLTELLNLMCSATTRMIKEGEVVKLFDWGTRRVTIGYGAYVWDEQERAFVLELHKGLNDHFGFEMSGIDDRYDLFRTSPEKLNAEELRVLKTYE